MRPDTTARRRHELTRAKAVQALRELNRAGAPITFQALANAASVSRSWLYQQPDIRAQIERLRDTARHSPVPPVPPVPVDQHASEASVLARLQNALKRNRELAEENQRLRRQLAHALGEQRRPANRREPDPARQPRRSSTTIGPC